MAKQEGVPAPNTAFVAVYEKNKLFDRIRVCMKPLPERNWMIEHPAYSRILIGGKPHPFQRSVNLTYEALTRFKLAKCKYEVATIGEAIEELQKIGNEESNDV